eukprot:comp11996_c0_seq1/m.6688 comp11996_c0_seq1/g.6688  ORF comp11996_c0_seq1/g.6688 comp11996_c0_seq1/m.6688 type:complete len:345 (-) comp11996_c0_seq1:258-1292(-)
MITLAMALRKSCFDLVRSNTAGPLLGATFAHMLGSYTRARYTEAKDYGRPMTIGMIRQMYESKTPIAVVTVYDYPSALTADKSKVDMVFIDESLAMWILGHSSPSQLKMEEMIHHAKAVANGATRAFPVADIPFGCYNTSPADSVKNAARLMTEGLVKGVKVRGGVHTQDTVRHIVAASVPVVGHVSPLRRIQYGGKRVSMDQMDAVLRDAMSFQEAGAFAVVLDRLPPEMAEVITKKLSIPTIGFRSGCQTSGHMGVLPYMLGLIQPYKPEREAKYAQLIPIIDKAIREYCDSVRAVEFPDTQKHCYAMPEEELRRFLQEMAAEGYEPKRPSSMLHTKQKKAV